ncbi:nucleoside recognition domain-containing protein [Pelagirhabdus alkalitolerans]|nr:nucleoside recognition domain-containing protein [Pelagirhabdus alkalitolerans]
MSILTLLFIIMPLDVLTATRNGLTLWIQIVLPSLLPFFILGDLLLQLGIVTFIGTLFEPFMRKIFNVSGEGAFILLIGMISGYPTGAKFIAQMKKRNIISLEEAERLSAYSNASNPLFILSAIAIGLFHNQMVGWVLAFTHYGSNILVAISMRSYKRSTCNVSHKNAKKLSPLDAFRKMHTVRLQHSKSFFEILSDAIFQSIQTLMMIGGFIISFSILSHLLMTLSIIDWLSIPLIHLLEKLNAPPFLASPFINGLLEVTLGANSIASVDHAPLILQILLIAILLAFNGLCIQAQIITLLKKANLSIKPYFLGRLLQIIYSIGIVVLIHSFLPIQLVEHVATSSRLIQQSVFHIHHHFQVLTLMILVLIWVYMIFYLLFNKQKS